MNLTARDVFNQNVGEVTTAYYKKLAEAGPGGVIAVDLFRAQKRSTRAKAYRPGKFRGAAYEVKAWSLEQLCRRLEQSAAQLGIVYGWRKDPNCILGGDTAWVLYVDLPTGQASFHSPDRFAGPDYHGEWCGKEMASADVIIRFCDAVMAENQHKGQAA